MVLWMLWLYSGVVDVVELECSAVSFTCSDDSALLYLLYLVLFFLLKLPKWQSNLVWCCIAFVVLRLMCCSDRLLTLV